MFKHSGAFPPDDRQNALPPIPGAHKREAEIALDLAQTRHGVLAWVGETGMGKSALLAHATERISASGARIISVPTRKLAQDSAEIPSLEFLFDQLLALNGGGNTSSLDAFDLLKNAVANPTQPQITQLCRELSNQIGAASRAFSIVFVVDDLELIDEITREVLIGAVAQRHAPAVVLITVSDQNIVRTLPYEVERRTLSPVTNSDALSLLRQTFDTPIAPHIARELNSHVEGAPHSLIETARSLSSAQLAGLSQLPDPLPTSFSTRQAISKYLVGIPLEDRAALLTAALSVTSRMDLILAAIDRNTDSLLMSSAARFLQIRAGHISIADARVRAVINAESTLAERAAAHENLARAHAEGGSPVTALWHKSQAALEGDETLAEQLISVAQRMLELGSAQWAQRVAREAISHATGASRPRAMAIAGHAALHAGHLADAIGLLREAIRLLPKDEASHVSASLTVAITLSTGQVPEGFADDNPHAQNFAAILYTERGRRGAAARIISRLAQHESGIGLDKIALLRAWSHTLAGEFASGLDILPTKFSEVITLVGSRVVGSLSLMGTGSVTQAHRKIATAISELSATTSSPWEPEFHEKSFKTMSATPLLATYLHLADILIEYASGNLSGAQKTLEHAVFALPMTLPAAGLICAVAGRLSALRTGTTGELATTLEELLPKPFAPLIHTEILANRALAHLLVGEIREAETLSEITNRARFRTLPLIMRPNHLDIMALLAPHDAPDQSNPSSLSTEVAKVDDGGDGQNINALDVALHHLLSARQRLAQSTGPEGTKTPRSGEVQHDVDQLLRSAMLFNELGASALAGLAQNWAQMEGAAHPGSQQPGSHQFGSLHQEAAKRANNNPQPTVNTPAWAADLTPREREVAQIIASGTSNREAASILFVSVRTIEVHLTSIFRKLEIGSRVELAIVVNRTPAG